MTTIEPLFRPPAPPISLSRCDRCPQAAMCRFNFANGGYLFGCAHHEKEWGPKTAWIPGVSVTYLKDRP